MEDQKELEGPLSPTTGGCQASHLWSFYFLFIFSLFMFVFFILFGILCLGLLSVLITTIGLLSMA